MTTDAGRRNFGAGPAAAAAAAPTGGGAVVPPAMHWQALQCAGRFSSTVIVTRRRTDLHCVELLAQVTRVRQRCPGRVPARALPYIRVQRCSSLKVRPDRALRRP